MTTKEIISRLENIAKHAVHTVGEEPFVMSLDDGIAVHKAISILQAQMKGDTISRQDTIDAIVHKLCIKSTDFLLPEEERIIDVIRNLPSVEPERKKGKWIFSDTDYLTHCSVCGQSDWKGYIPTPEEATKWMPICPKCGTKMEKGEIDG